MNFGELKTYAFDFLGSADGHGPWSASAMGRYIQDAHYKVHGLVADEFENFFATTALLSEVSGTDLISLPTDCYRILSVERVSGGSASANNPTPLEKIDRRVNDIQRSRGSWFNTAGTAAYPDSYYSLGQKQIRLVPVPSNTTASSLRLTYIFRPAPLSGDTDVPFQQTAGTGGAGFDNLIEFHDLLPLYAIEACLLTPGEENPALAQSIQGRRLERENELKTYLSRINLQSNKRMEITDAVTEYD